MTISQDPKPGATGIPRIKGLAMLNLASAMKAVRPDVGDLVPAELRPYLEGRVLVSTWYPEADHLRLMRILTEWIRRPGKDVWHYLGRKNAEIDLGGIYSAMVLSGRPDATLQRTPRIWSLYRDSGSPAIRDVGKGSGVFELREYSLTGPEMAGLMAGYIEELLRQAGAAEPACESTADGTGDGVMVWQASWRA